MSSGEDGEKSDAAPSVSPLNDHGLITIFQDREQACLQDLRKMVDCWTFRTRFPSEVKGLVRVFIG
jgi:hypothetical protein